MASRPWTPLGLATPSRHLRAIAALGATEAADRLGVAVTTVTSPEQRERRGETSPHLTRLIALADAYGLDVEIRVRRR